MPLFLKRQCNGTLPCLPEIPALPRLTLSADRAQEELDDYAEYLGINITREPDLLWIAEEAYFAPLPDGFEEHADERGEKYFFNPQTDESAWAHPMDSYFRKMAEVAPLAPSRPPRRADG